MKYLRLISGLLGLLGLAVALNLLVLKEDLSTTAVLLPLAAGFLFGALWLVLRLATLTETFGQGKTVYGIYSAVGVMVFFAICILLYGFGSRWDREWDLTQEGRRALAPQTRQVLQALPSEVEVTAFFVKANDSVIDAAREKTQRFLEQCQQYTPRLKVEFVDPVAEPARVAALNLEEERLATPGTVVLKCGSRPPRVLPLSGVTGRLEERDFTNALINVSRRSQPKVYFLQGHDERNPDLDAKAHPKRGSLLFKVRLQSESYLPTSLTFGLEAPKVPDDCEILIINDPELPLRPDEIEAIQRYLDRGGRLLLLLDPPVARPPLEVLNTWLFDRYGIAVGNDILLSSLSDKPRDIYLLPDTGQVAAKLTSRPFPQDFPGCFSKQHPITRGFDKDLVLRETRSVDLAPTLPEGVVGEVILRSLPFTYAETDLNLLAQGKANQDPDEPSGWPSIAAAVTARTAAPVGDTQKTRDARIVVIGDGDIASNEGMIFVGHINLLMNAMAWLSESEELIAIRPTGKEDPPIILTAGEEQFIAWVACLGILQAVVLTGIAVQVWRRRYQ
ncbi:MAG: Gldg family protein [FCB group bacterium]|nr:Gldg family protein [FCB group bacterium]